MPFMTDASRWPQFRAGEYGNWDALLIQYIAIWSLHFFRLLSLVTLHELGLCSGLAGEAGLTVIDKLQGDSVNYVNIPISPTSKRQLHYMELDLQDHPESSHTVRGTLCSSQYILHISWPQRQKKHHVCADCAPKRPLFDQNGLKTVTLCDIITIKSNFSILIKWK